MAILRLPRSTLRTQFEEAQACAIDLEQMSGNDLASSQFNRLRATWSDCVADVPYYKKLVELGEAPREIESWSDFKALPILDRRTLQQRAPDFIRRSSPPDSFISTAGSTGQPVQMGQWRQGMDSLRVAKLVPWIRLGYTLDDSLYLIWGHAHLLGTGWRRHYNHMVRKLKDRIAGYRRVDAYSLDPKKAAKIATEIIRIRPAGLIGYAAVLDLFCRYTADYHADLRAAGLKFVMPCAEPPPREDTFDLFRSVFGCPIVQEFGGVDFGHVGFKVDEAPYTLFPDLNILEVESNNPESDSGPALVTTLYRRYVPLIRYRQGDVITGVKFSEEGLVKAFDEQIGRVGDMIRLSENAVVHSEAIAHCLRQEPSVLNMQLVLHDEGPSFSLVVREPLARHIEVRIRHRLRQVHPQLERAPFNYVTDVGTNRAGKRRWVLDLRTTSF